MKSFSFLFPFILFSSLLFSAQSINSANAQETTPPVPKIAYSGCVFAWNYQADQADLVESFTIQVEGKTAAYSAAKADRKFSCDTIANGIFGTQTWTIRAWNPQLGFSKPASILVDFKKRPAFGAPTNLSVK